MLTHTFIHIPGIGLRTERQLWRQGILTWHDFITHYNDILLTNVLREESLRIIKESEHSLADYNPEYFITFLLQFSLYSLSF